MADATHNHHEIDYIEFGVTDMAEAQRFYSAAFDWEFTDYGPEFPGGRRFQFTDPSGNELAVWSDR